MEKWLKHLVETLNDHDKLEVYNDRYELLYIGSVSGVKDRYDLMNKTLLTFLVVDMVVKVCIGDLRNANVKVVIK